jgi:membrane-associated phospholipid phosphatase
VPIPVATLLVVALACAGCAAAPSGVHASPGAFVQGHFDGASWREYVGRDYFGAGQAALPAALAVGAALVLPADDRLSETLGGTLGDPKAVGDVGVSTLVVGALALGAVRPGPGRPAWDQTWSNLEALWITYGLTEAGKAAFGRTRPDGSSSTSFPSGHAATAFAAATLVQREAGPAFGLPAYGLAGLVAWSRVDADRHYASDVLAGAALGCLVAGVVDSLHFGSGPGRGIVGRCRLQAGPTEDGVAVGLSLDL